MNCQEFDHIMLDLARACIADAATQRVALNHAQSCPRCADRLSHQRKLTRALQAVSAAAGNEEAPPRAEYALLDAFRKRHGASLLAGAQEAGPPRRGGTAVRPVWAAALAAMVLLALVAAWKLRPTSPVRSVEEVSSEGANREGEKATPFRNGEAQPASAAVRHVASHRHQAPKHAVPSQQVAAPEQTAMAEATTRFYPLPYGSGLGLDQGWAMVRVQVRRSSLASLGVPVNAGSAASEMLTADVVVGQDGLARGIRFVQ